MMSYLGAFRLPRGASNGLTMEFAFGALAYRPGGLFVAGKLGHVCEVTIPEPVNSSNFADLPFAEYKQGWINPFLVDGVDTRPVGSSTVGLCVIGDVLILTAVEFYDADYSQRKGHCWRPVDLTVPSVTWTAEWNETKQGFVAGYMADIPEQHQEALGGRLITGLFGTNIITNSSWGPAAFAIGHVDATPLVYYDSAHPTLGPWSGSSPIFGATSKPAGAAFIDDHLYFFGRNGMGPYSYGEGVGIDPTDSSKGPHAYPHRFQWWRYPISDLAKVAAGERQPWDLIPEVEEFQIPTITGMTESQRLTGCTYDPESRRLYLAYFKADKDGFQSRPLIYVFEVPRPEPPPVVVIPDSAEVLALKAEIRRLTGILNENATAAVIMAEERDVLLTELTTLRGNVQKFVEGLDSLRGQ